MSSNNKTMPVANPELLQVAVQAGASRRIENCLRAAYAAGRLSIRTVEEYLSHSVDGPPAVFFAIQNMGAKSRRELHEIVLAAAAHGLNGSSAKANDVIALNVEVPSQESRAVAARDFSAIVESSLTERELSVIRRRFGLAGYDSQTLEIIGSRLGVTRERIRQIEKKALKKLASRNKLELQSFIRSRSDQTVEHLWAGIPWASSSDLVEREKTLPGELVLALYAAFQERTEWMSELATPTHRGWLLKQLAVDTFTRCVGQVSSYLTSARLPLSAQVVASSLGMTSTIVAAAVLAGGEHRVYRGYICPMIVGARTRRAISLVETLQKLGRGHPMSIRKLADACRASNAQIGPTTRDVIIVLASHKHLFVNLYEEGWATSAPDFATVGISEAAVDDTDVQTESSEAHDAELDRPTFEGDDKTLRAFLIKLLRATGPMQMAEIRDALDRTPSADFSRASVGPMLLLYEDFIRIAPGIYALREDWLQEKISIQDVERLLLTEPQCTVYVQSRWAGEPQHLYPAWTASMELAWARWARRCQRPELFESLMAVARPESWPVGPTERKAWAATEVGGRLYSLVEVLRIPLDETVPSFLDVLSASLWARHQGHLSWISANRTAGRRIEDRHAASTLALLIVFGILEPAEHWQARHRYRADAEATITCMLDFACRVDTGWPNELTKSAAHGLSAIADRGGWLRPLDLTGLLEQVCAQGSAATSKDPRRLETQGTERDVLEDLRLQLRRSRLAGLINA